MTLANAHVFKIYISHPIFSISVELGTDPSSKCRDYNTLRPPRVQRVVIFSTLYCPGFPIWMCLKPIQTRNIAYCHSVTYLILRYPSSLKVRRWRCAGNKRNRNGTA